MIVGMGVDIAEVARIRAAIEKRRLFAAVLYKVIELGRLGVEIVANGGEFSVQ